MSKKVVEIGICLSDKFVKICSAPIYGVNWLKDANGQLVKLPCQNASEWDIDLYIKYEDGEVAEVTTVIDNPCAGEEVWYVGIEKTDGKYYLHTFLATDERYDITEYVIGEEVYVDVEFEDGTRDEVRKVAAFEVLDTKKQYLLYVEEDDECTLYMSIIDDVVDDVCQLSEIENVYEAKYIESLVDRMKKGETIPEIQYISS